MILYSVTWDTTRRDGRTARTGNRYYDRETAMNVYRRQLEKGNEPRIELKQYHSAAPIYA